MRLGSAVLVAALLVPVGCSFPPASAPKDPLANVAVAADLEVRLAKWAPVEIRTDLSALPAEDARLLRTLVEACDLADEIYWRQNSWDGAEWRERVRRSSDPRRASLLRALRLNAGRFDLLAHGEPFLGDGARPPGGGYWPADVTKDEIARHLESHPDDRAPFDGANNVIRRRDRRLVAVPLHEEFAPLVSRLAALLERAAGESRWPNLTAYLKRRAQDLRMDDYFESDSMWIDLAGTPYDLLIGPYETYGDELMGVKAAYTGVLMKVDAEASAKLDVYRSHLPDLERMLPSPPELKAKAAGASNPMTVVDTLYRTGDAAPGYQFVAFNLPNDPHVNEVKGSRKVMHRNFLRQRMQTTIRPIVAKLLGPEFAVLVSEQAYFDDVLFHEISHGLGAQTVVGTSRAVNAAIGEPYSGIEEAKADACGLLVGDYFVGKGLLSDGLRREHAAAFVGGALRSIRFASEAHAVAARIHLNRLLSAGAIRWDGKKLSVDLERVLPTIREEAKDLLVIEATGDAAKARELVGTDGLQSKPLAEMTKAVEEIPIDFEPSYVLR